MGNHNYQIFVILKIIIVCSNRHLKAQQLLHDKTIY